MAAGSLQLRSQSPTSVVLAPTPPAIRANALWREVRGYPAGAELPDAKRPEPGPLLLLSGWACLSLPTASGAMVPCALFLPGDVAEVGGQRGGTLRALTVLEVADCAALVAGGRDEEVPSRLSIEQSLRRGDERMYDHIVRMGQLSSRERVIHLLLELNDRLEPVGRARDGTFRIPLTQEFVADLLGLSLAHLKRTLQHLRRDGLVRIGRGWVTLARRERLVELSAYSRAAPAAELRPVGCPPRPARGSDIGRPAARGMTASPSVQIASGERA